MEWAQKATENPRSAKEKASLRVQTGPQPHEAKETGWRCDRSLPILDGSLLVGQEWGPELTPGSPSDLHGQDRKQEEL